MRQKALTYWELGECVTVYEMLISLNPGGLRSSTQIDSNWYYK